MELISSQPFPLEDEVIAWEPSDASCPNTLPVSGQEFFQRTESLSDSNKAANDSFFGQSLSPDSSNRNTSSSAYLHTDIPLVQKPHLLQPFASREALFGLKKPETAEEEELRLMGPKRPGILASARCEKEREIEQTDGGTDGQTDGGTDRQTEGGTDRQTDRRTDGRTNRRTDRQKHTNKHRQTDRQTDTQMHR